jgi:hypothetical protein
MDKDYRTQTSGQGSTLLLVGRNRHGDWVVRDRNGLHGKRFVNRGEALKYAMLPDAGRPRAVIMVPRALELDKAAAPL